MEKWQGDCVLSNNLSTEETEQTADNDRVELSSLFKDIEEIVHHLETEQVPLEEALRLFERGMRFCRQASHRLDEAEGVIQRLLRDPDTGEGMVVSWQEEEDSSSTYR